MLPMFSKQAKGVDALTKSIKGLTIEQAVEKMTAEGVADAEMKAALGRQGYEKETIESTMASYAKAAANKVEEESIESLTADKLIEKLVQDGMDKDDAESLVFKASVITTNYAESESVREVTEETIKQKLAKGLLTQEQAKVLLGTMANTSANNAEATSWQLLTLKIKENIAAMWTWLSTTPVGQVTLLVGAVAALIGVFAAATTNVKEHEEKLRDLKSEYSDVKDELDTLQREFDSTKEKIKELQNKGKLSFTEQEELDRLKAQNNELQRSIDLLEIEKKEKAEKVNEQFVATMSQDLTWKQFDYSRGYKSEQEYLEEQFKNLEELKDKQSNAKTEAERDRIQEQIDNVEQYLQDANESFKERAIDVEYIEEPTTDDDKAVNAWLDYINDFQDRMAISMGGENAKTNAFNRLVDNWQFDDALQGLQELGEQGKVTADDISKALEDPDESLETFIQKLVELGVIDSSENIDAIADAFNNLADAAENANEKLESTGNSVADSRMKMINNFNNLSEGFEELDKIYESIKDDDPFDFKLLDNDAFKNTFKDLGSVYADFIEQITSTPNDINKCKSAFNNLITEWIRSEGILEDLTEENKNVTISLLKQMGVVNAEEIVMKRLNAEKEYAAKTSKKLADATAEDINNLLEEKDVAEDTKNAIVSYYLEKQLANGITLNTSDEVKNLMNLISALGGATNALGIYYKALSGTLNYRDISGLHGSDFKYYQQMALVEAQKEINAINNDLANYKVSYGGGSSSNKTSGSGSSAKDKTSEFFDWLERRIKKFQEAFDKWLTRAEQALTKGFVNYYYNQASKQLSNLMNTQAEAYSYYLQKANAVNLSDSYKKKVREGSISIQEITDEKVKEAISKYQEYYDKATEALTAFEEAADQFYNIPLDALARKIELFSDAIDILEAKIDNAIGSTNKNKLIDQQISKQADILSTSNFAKLNAEKNLEEAKKQLNTSANLKGLSDANKNDVQDRIKAGNQVNLALFTEGSDAWKAAVRYNEALQANTEATNEYNKQLQETIAFERELAKAKFDNIAQDYERKIEMLDHGVTALDNKIAEAEARGQAVSIDYYKEQLKIEGQKKAILLEEQEALEKQLETIPKGTDEWYDAYAALQDVSSAISECTQNTYELNKAINEAHFALFDNIHSEIDRLMDEQEFLRSMMAHEKRVDDKGNFTEAGYANLASLTASLEASKANAANDKAMVERLDKMIESGELSDGELTFNSLEELEEAREKYYDSWRDDIKETYSLQQEIFDAMQEQYQAEIDAMQELIDTKKEALQAEKDLYEYQKSIAEKTKNISKLQKQMAAYQGDTSEEGRAKLQRLQVQLEEAQEDLKDTEMQKAFDDQNQLLDDLMEEYQELIDKKLEDFMGVVQEGMDEANANSATANEYLSGLQESIGYTSESGSLISSTDTISNQVSTIISQLTEIEKSISGLNSVDDEDTSDITTAPAPTTPGNTTSDLSQSTQDKLKEDASNVTASPGADKPSTSTSSSSNSSSGSSSSSSKPKVSSIKATLKEGSKGSDVKTLQKALNMHQKAGLDVDGIFGTKTKKAVKKFQKDNKIDQDGIVGKNTKAKFKKHGYATGSKYIPYDEIAWTQEKGQELIYSRSQNAMLTPLGKGDKVFTNEMTNKLWELAQGELPEVPMKYLDLADISGKITKYISKFEGAYGDNIVNVQCAFPNITDGAKAQDMIREIQRSPKLQQALQDVTVNRVVPNNRSGRLSVNTIK